MSTFVHGLYGTHLAKPARRRRRVRWSRVLSTPAGVLAAGLGHVLRLATVGSRYLPGLGAGTAFVTGGFLLASWVGWGVLGVVLLALDRRVAARRDEVSAS